MANSKSAKKRIRQNRRALERNRKQRSQLRTAMKRVRDAEDGDAATERYRKASALLDRCTTRNLVHKNYAARKKSQLARVVKEKGGSV